MTNRIAPKIAIIAAAGFGTRFLPWTKAMPKEMIPLSTKPVIQYVVEELTDAGVEEIIIVGNSSKRAIEDHFDYPSSDLVANLKKGGKSKLKYIEQVNDVAELAKFIYLRQKGPYGNGTPIMTASHLIKDEPFLFMFADDLFYTPEGVKSQVQQMIDTYTENNVSVLACMKVQDPSGFNSYGIVAGTQVDPSVIDVKTIIEKPGVEKAPSDLASVSGYLFTAEFIKFLARDYEKYLKDTREDKGEFMIQPTIQKMINAGCPFYAREIVGGKYYDLGNPLGFLKATVEFGIRDSEYGEEFTEYLKELDIASIKD